MTETGERIVVSVESKDGIVRQKTYDRDTSMGTVITWAATCFIEVKSIRLVVESD